MKVCIHCKQRKPLDSFYRNKNSADGRHRVCKPCCQVYGKRYYQLTGARHREQAKARYWKKTNVFGWRFTRYGVTQEIFDAAVRSQGGGCAICKEPLKPGRGTHLDHDHALGWKKGGLRGVLCSTCNTGLGKFRDSVELLDRAKIYLLQPMPRRFE